jgi:hypothetical protein
MRQLDRSLARWAPSEIQEAARTFAQGDALDRAPCRCCGRIGRWMDGVAPWWEPYERRRSRTVLREPKATYLLKFSCGEAGEALNWTRQLVTRMGVTLNEARPASSKRVRRASFSRSHLRAASLQEGWPLVFGGKPVEKGGGTYQGEGGKPSGARQPGDQGGCAGPAESDFEGLVGVLQLRNPDNDVLGG